MNVFVPSTVPHGSILFLQGTQQILAAPCSSYAGSVIVVFTQ